MSYDLDAENANFAKGHKDTFSLKGFYLAWHNPVTYNLDERCVVIWLVLKASHENRRFFYMRDAIC